LFCDEKMDVVAHQAIGIEKETACFLIPGQSTDECVSILFIIKQLRVADASQHDVVDTACASCSWVSWHGYHLKGLL
jgi:RNase P subunit RPR2